VTDFFEPQLWPFAGALGLVVGWPSSRRPGFDRNKRIALGHGDVTVELMAWSAMAGLARTWQRAALVISSSSCPGLSALGFPHSLRCEDWSAVHAATGAVVSPVIAVSGFGFWWVIEPGGPREETECGADAEPLSAASGYCDRGARAGRPAETRVVMSTEQHTSNGGAV